MCSYDNTLSICVAFVLYRMSRNSVCSVWFGTFWITNVGLTDAVLIFAETKEVVSETLGPLIHEPEPLKLRVTWKVKAFDEISDTTSVPVIDENIEVAYSVTYGCVIYPYWERTQSQRA